VATVKEEVIEERKSEIKPAKMSFVRQTPKKIVQSIVIQDP